MPSGAKLLLAAASIIIGSSCSPILVRHASAAPAAGVQTKAEGITVSPTQKVLTLSSGLLEAHSEIVLSNNTAQELDVVMSIRDLTKIYDNGDQSFGQAGLPVGKYGLANWASLPDGESITIAAGESKTVPVIIENRADLSPGGHYGAIVTSLKNSTGTGATPVNIQQNLLSFLFVQKLGGEKLGMSLQSFAVDNKKVIPNDVSLSFKSTGNVYVVPRGYVSVFDPKGRLVAKGIINTESAFVLPETTRSFDTMLQATTTKKLAPGKYKVVAAYRYDGHTDYETATRTIGVTNQIPVLILAAFVTGVLGIVLLLETRRLNKRRSK
jgi:hypothetical protein